MTGLLAAAIFSAAFCAFIISATAGGGAGLVLLPLLRLIVPISGVPAALSIGTAVSSISRIALFYSAIRWDIVRRFLPTALPAAILGVWLLTRLQPAYIDLCIAGFLLSNIRALFAGKPEPATASTLSPRYVPWIGVAAGVLSGFSGAVGLAFNGVYQRLGLDRREIIATRAMNEVTLHVVKIISYALAGVLSRASIAAGCLVALAAVLATITVKHVLSKVRDTAFRRISAWTIVISGIVMFSISGTEIARLQQSWVQLIGSNDERELQLYWHGRLHWAAETDAGHRLLLERTMRFAQLPPSVQDQFRALAGSAAVVSVEEVVSVKERLFEITYTAHGSTKTIELRATE